MSNNEDQKAKLLKIVRDALARDKELREEFGIGEKFRFIRDRLQALLTRVEEKLNELEEKKAPAINQQLDDYTHVYVYLYNAHGLVLQTWQKMLNPSVFYEYSVNRPIYLEKSHIQAFIRSRPHKPQHAFLTIAIKRQDVINPESVTSKDAIGNPLVRVKEGSLRAEKLIALTINGHDYKLNAEGMLVKLDGLN